MYPLRTKPISRDEDAAVDTDGVAFLIPSTVATRQIKLYVGAAAYVGIGTSDTPPAASENNSVHQEAESEVVYTLDGVPATDGSYLYVYAASGTLAARISFYG